MSRRQREGRGGHDHGAHTGHFGVELWGKRPNSYADHCAFEKRRCRRMERRISIADLYETMARLRPSTLVKD